MRVKSITIELDVNEIFQQIDIEKVNIGEIMAKHNFSIVEQSNNEKLLMIANELLEYNDIVIGFACYTIEEINQINDHLKKHNLSLNTVYVPSEERIEDRKQKAIKEQQKWGYRDGVSDEEIERNFAEFKNRIQKIKEELKHTFINVKAV